MQLTDLIRINDKIIDYYNLPECIPTKKNYELWLNSLSKKMKSHFQKEGFEKCKTVLNYKRFILENQDIGLNDYLKKHLSIEDFNQFIQTEQ